MTVALTVLRRTPMRWFALLMASIQVAMMLTDFHSWRLVLSQASAAVTTPWLFLAPLAAAGAAWTTRHLQTPSLASPHGTAACTFSACSPTACCPAAWCC